MSTQEPFPLTPDPRSSPDPAAPEVGFSPLAIIGTIKEIQANIALVKQFLVALAPLVQELLAALGKDTHTPAAAQFRATAEKLGE